MLRIGLCLQRLPYFIISISFKMQTQKREETISKINPTLSKSAKQQLNEAAEDHLYNQSIYEPLQPAQASYIAAAVIAQGSRQHYISELYGALKSLRTIYELQRQGTALPDGMLRVTFETVFNAAELYYFFLAEEDALY